MQVIKTINEKTQGFDGMKIPVTVIVDTATKQYEIEIGVPSTAALIMKEAGIKKGSGAAGTEWAGDVTIDSILKVAKTKLEASYASSLKSVAKSIIGTCMVLGVKIDGKTPREMTSEINDGKHDELFI